MSALIFNFEMDDNLNTAIAERMIQIRKAQGFTQTQVAQALNITQGSYGHYETGFRRVPVEMLPAIAEALQTSVEELLGLDNKPTKRGPKSQLERRFEKIRALPKKEQRFVMEALDRLLQKAS